MLSGTFHQLSQDWQYSPKSKSLTQTLHLAQLVSGTPVGSMIGIPPTPSTFNNNGLGGFGVPPLQLPGAPSIRATIFNTFYQQVDSPCYGCVSSTQEITAQKNCGIQILSWTNGLMQVKFFPTMAGKFILHIEAQTDLRDSAYQGPTSAGDCQVKGYIDGSASASISSNEQLLFTGAGWGAGRNIFAVLHSNSSIIANVTSLFDVQGTNLGDPAGTPPAGISAYLLMIDAHA